MGLTLIYLTRIVKITVERRKISHMEQHLGQHRDEVVNLYLVINNTLVFVIANTFMLETVT